MAKQKVWSPADVRGLQRSYEERLQHNENTIARIEDQLRTATALVTATKHAAVVADAALTLALRERASYHAALAMHERYLAVLEAVYRGR